MTKPRPLGNKARDLVSEAARLSSTGREQCQRLTRCIENGDSLRALRAAAEIKAILAEIETSMVKAMNGGE